MPNKPSIRTIGWILISISGLASIFHLLILLQVVPYSVTWGGRLQSYDEVLVMVPVSLAVNLIFITVVSVKSGIWNLPIPEKILNGVLWVMVVVFALNTLGNLMAVTWAEKLIATPLTLAGSLLAYRLVSKR